MELSAPKGPTRLGNIAAAWFDPEFLKVPGIVGLSAAGHVALVVNAKPETLPEIWQIATLNPLLTVVCLAILVFSSVQASRLSDRPITVVRQLTLSLIAGCLFLFAADVLNVIKTDLQPWSPIIAGATGLVLVGGLTTLLWDARAVTRS